MPPLEWSIIQSLLLNLVLPGFAVAMGIQLIVCWITRSEALRSVAESLAFLSSIVVVDYRNDLVPVVAVKRVQAAAESSARADTVASRIPFQFETGWYSLVSVTLAMVVVETLLNWRFGPNVVWFRFAIAITPMIILVSIWLMPWDVLSSKPWSGFAMAGVILINALILRQIGQSNVGDKVPLVTAIVWCGSATALAVLSHSARFADLAMMLGCSLTAVGILNWFTRQKSASFYTGPATFIPGLMLETSLNTYSDIPFVSYVLVAIAPASLALISIAKTRKWIERRPIALIIAPMIACGIAIGLAIRAEL